MRRGRVRAALLALLRERPMHGYEMITELAERTGGVWRPSPGSVYPTLQVLQDEGLVEGRSAAGRRLFALTEAGRVAAPPADAPRPWDTATCEACARPDPPDTALRHAVGQLLLAVDQLLDAGTPDQKAMALAPLADARRAIYLALAGDDPSASGPRGGDGGPVRER